MTTEKGQPIARIERIISGLFGLACCRRRVGARRSLSVGFGAQQWHGDPKLVDSFYGVWEVGTYYAAWRIGRAGRVLCGSEDVVDSIEELDDKVALILMGRPSAIRMLSEFDVRLNFDDQGHLDFLGTHSEVDEHVVHFFGPDGLYVEYSLATGWVVGTSTPPLV